MKETDDSRQLLEYFTPRKKIKRERYYDTPLPNTTETTNHQLAVIEPDTPKLTPREYRFCQLYTAHYQRDRAAIEAGYPAARASIVSRDLLKDYRVKYHIAKLEESRLMKMNIDPEMMFRKIIAQNLAIAYADAPFEIVVPPCRYCYGTNHEYQRTHEEETEALKDHESHRHKRGDRPIDPLGGSGYDETITPNPDCPNCHGRGDTRFPVVHFQDTRFMSPDQKALIAGVEVGQYGPKIRLENRQAARDFLAQMAFRLMDLNRDVGRSGKEFDISKMTVEDLEDIVGAAKKLGLVPEDEEFNDDD
jgi:phage terminase small subunit